MKYIKKPIPLAVAFATLDGELSTLEGPVNFAAGDAILTGLQGERWPVPRATFESNYYPVDAMSIGEDGYYLKHPRAVEAHQTFHAMLIPLSNDRGSLHARPGDWIITDASGDQWVVADTIFQQTYEEYIGSDFTD